MVRESNKKEGGRGVRLKTLIGPRGVEFRRRSVSL